MTEPRIGQVVYPCYSPQRVGVILEIVERCVFPEKDGRGNPSRYAGEPTGNYRVRIKWSGKKGGEEVRDTWGLRDFQTLVLEHESKAKKHRATLDRLTKEST